MQEDLAKRANVALTTVRDFEKGRRGSSAHDVDAMRTALEMAGVTMVFEDGGKAVGIRGKPKTPVGDRARG